MYRTDMQMLLSMKMESSKARAMSRSKTNSSCRKHPKHRQSPGVCSICLSEKLSQLASSDSSSSSSRAARSRSSSSSVSSYVSSLSSSHASSDSSPAAEMDARNSIRVFRKSRSMAIVSNKIGIVKGGFWSKLLSRKKSKNGGLMHSRTTRETVASAIH